MHIPLTKIMHDLLKPHLNQSAMVIDATCGNGNDTCFLARHAKEVYAFDIQKTAIENTKLALKKAQLDNVRVIHDSHENLALYLVQDVTAVIFNLGYLPKGSKAITTTKETTLSALAVALEIVKPKGLISIMLYPGHQEGKSETEAVLKWVKSLPKTSFDVLSIEKYLDENAPKGLLIQKKG